MSVWPEPEQHEVAYFLGVVQRRMGKVDEAIASFDRIPPEHERYADGRVQVAGMPLTAIWSS